MPTGRPPIWDDPDKFAQSVDQYFDDCEQDKTNPTWTGLALHLGFESRQSLQDYKEKDGFSYPIKKALAKIEENYEQGLFSRNPAGAIFALKNFGWRDKHEVDHTTKGDKIEASPTINVYNSAPPISESEDQIH